MAIHQRSVAQGAPNPAKKNVAQQKADAALAAYRKAASPSLGGEQSARLGRHARNAARLRRAIDKATREYIALAHLEAAAPAVTATKGASANGLVDGVLLIEKVAKKFIKAFNNLGPSGRSIVASEFERFLPRKFGTENHNDLTDEEGTPEIRVREIVSAMQRIARYAPHVAADLADEQGVHDKDAWTRWIRDLVIVCEKAELPVGAGSDLTAAHRPSPFICLVNELMRQLPEELRHHFVAGDYFDANSKSRVSALAGAIKETKYDKTRKRRAGGYEKDRLRHDAMERDIEARSRERYDEEWAIQVHDFYGIQFHDYVGDPYDC